MITIALLNLVEAKRIDYKHICGVPFTAMSIATLLSVKQMKSMLFHYNGIRSGETRKLTEGKFVRGDSCLIIEDIIETGSSVIETVNDLRAEGF